MSESGLTVEDVNAMQDEMNKIEGINEDESIKDVDVKDDKTEDKVDDKSDIKTDEKDDGKEDKINNDDINVIRELKEQLRVSNESLQKMTKDHQKLHKVLVDKGLITDEEIKADKEAEDAVKAAYEARQEKLIEMVAVMEVNPTYADVREVCTQSNMDDVVDALAHYWVKENGGSLRDVSAKLESEIWAEPNPYKKLYEVIKLYHPKYAPTKDGKDSKTDDTAKDKKDKKPVDVQPSAAVVATGGTGSGGTGWTAEKIDALDEDELSKVPKDIYDRYLAGTLK